MERFLVIAPHTKEECQQALEQVLSAGFITHFDWGCKDGEHTGWAILEASNSKEAMMAVPPAQRHSASVVRLTRFSPADIDALHRK